MRKRKTDFYWQKSINSERKYVAGPQWLFRHVRAVRLLEVYMIHPQRKKAKVMAYLEDGALFFAIFKSLEAAQLFVTQVKFDHSNKEIHSS